MCFVLRQNKQPSLPRNTIAKLIFLIEILNGEIQEKLRSKAAFSP